MNRETLAPSGTSLPSMPILKAQVAAATLEAKTPDMLTPAEQAARQLKLADKLNARLMIQTLRRGEVPMFEAMFAQMSDLRLPLVQRLLYEPGGAGQVSAQSGVRGAAGGAVDLGRALGFYDKVAVDTAQKVLERWRRDPNYLYAIKTIELGQGGAPDGPAE